MASVTRPDLSGKRVLVLGAETELGRAVASALSEAGAVVAVVAATSDAEAAFTVQRLSRRLAARGRRSPAQAIDAANEMAVRVMVRQVAKELGGLDALVFSADLGPETQPSLELALRFGARELARGGGGRFVPVGVRPETVALELPAGTEVRAVGTEGKAVQEVVSEALRGIADGPDNG